MSLKKLTQVSVASLALVFAFACATATDDEVTQADVIEPATAQTHDPVGPPPRVESQVGAMHPSSVTGGAGNPTASGTNTNLNPPEPAEGTVEVTQSDIVVTQTPSETVAVVETTPEPVVIEERTTIVETPPTTTVTTRTLVTKD